MIVLPSSKCIMNELHLLHVISTLTNLSFWCIHSLCPLTSTDGDLGSGFAHTLWSLGHKLRCPNLVLSPTVIFPCIFMYFPWQMYICFFHLISFFFGAISQTINVRDFFFSSPHITLISIRGLLVSSCNNGPELVVF